MQNFEGTSTISLPVGRVGYTAVLVCPDRGKQILSNLSKSEKLTKRSEHRRPGALIAGTWAAMQYMGYEYDSYSPNPMVPLTFIHSV